MIVKIINILNIFFGGFLLGEYFIAQLKFNYDMGFSSLIIAAGAVFIGTWMVLK